MARPHLTAPRTPVQNLIADFVQRMDNASKKFKGRYSRTLTDDYVTMKYTTEKVSETSSRTKIDCNCTIRRIRAGNDLEAVFQFLINDSPLKPDGFKLSVEDAEKKLLETINMLETGVKLSEIRAFVLQQGKTTAESISDIKKKLDRLMEESETLKTVADKVYSAFANAPEAKRSNKNRPEANGDSMIMEFRYWGEWEIPPGEEDDGDYDWRQPTEKTYQVAKKIISDLSSKYPDFKIEMSVEEKDYLVITVRAK